MVDPRRDRLVEEQALLRYHKKCYFPVSIGHVFKDRYRIISKLGFGAYSTVWLVRDERLLHIPLPSNKTQLTSI